MSFKVLFLSRNYPNNVVSTLGLWVEGLVRQISAVCECRVIAPVPYCPPLLPFRDYSRFRDIAMRDRTNGVEVLHPRFLTGPGYSLHNFEANLYYWGVRGHVAKLHREFPFDLIHAHFTYPDGVVAARLAQHYRVPLVITEHAPWLPWMEEYPRVRRQAVWTSRQCAFLIAPSRYARDSIACFTGESEKLRVVPNGVDGSIFALPQNEHRPVSNQILFVGIMRMVKGVDILLHAMRRLVDRGRDVRLAIVGESFYRKYRRDQKLFFQMVESLQLQGHVRFLGPKSPKDVARHMRESALLVLPSRAESFGVVLSEALACGTPVVATRCGGPEDIVNDQVGILVSPEDPEALAQGIEHVLERRSEYDPVKLRAYALDKFSVETVGSQIFDLYTEALDRFRKRSELQYRGVRRA